MRTFTLEVEYCPCKVQSGVGKHNRREANTGTRAILKASFRHSEFQCHHSRGCDSHVIPSATINIL